MVKTDGSTRLAVFYDQCVPLDPFKQLLPELAKFSEHVFLHNGPRLDDYEILDKAEKIRREKFPNHLSLLVTFDREFIKGAKGHPALGATIRVVQAPASNTKFLNVQRAAECAQLLVRIQTSLLLGKNPKDFSWNSLF